MDHVVIGGTEYRFYDHLYAVSRCGKFLRKLQPVQPKLRPDGYLSVGRRRLAHRMVAAVWVPNPANAKHVHHINHIKHDNRAENLEWLTPKEHLHGRHSDQLGKHTVSDEIKQRLRELRLGSVTSEATKQKQREAALRLGCKPPPRPVGAKCSAEAIAKMRQNSPNAQRCEIFGVVYSSFSEAGRALGERPHTLRKRCLSKNFPEHKLVP